MNAASIPERLPSPPPRRRGRPPGGRNAPRAVETAAGAVTVLSKTTGIGWRLELDEVIRLRCRAMEHGLTLGDYLAGVLRDSLREPSSRPGNPSPPLMDPTGELCGEAIKVLEGWRALLLSLKRERQLASNDER